MRTLGGLSYQQIGRELGGRDHSTIMHAQQRMERLLPQDPATRQDLEKLRHLLFAR
jgi:chromosomal replication initiator protein